MTPNYDKKLYNLRYHGSNVYFDIPKISFSKGFKDFGCGFYLSECFSHAEARAISGSRKTNEAYVYEYLVPKRFPDELSIKIFRGASEAWLDFIMENRKHKNTIHTYDVVIGPTADSNTVGLIDDYTNGKFGVVGSQKAKRQLLGLLKTDRYPTQTCLCTSRALTCITKVNEIPVG